MMNIIPILLAAGCAGGNGMVDNILIEGNSAHIKEPDFTEKVAKALKLLQSKAGAEYANLKKYTGKIRASAHSGANFNEKIMTIDVAKSTFDASTEWLASVFIHENLHLQKFKETGKKYGDAHLMKDKKEALKVMIAEELECNKLQCAVLTKIGGQGHEIKYLEALKGDHFDIDKDGDYDDDDFKGRTW